MSTFEFRRQKSTVSLHSSICLYVCQPALTSFPPLTPIPRPKKPISRGNENNSSDKCQPSNSDDRSLRLVCIPSSVCLVCQPAPLSLALTFPRLPSAPPPQSLDCPRRGNKISRERKQLLRQVSTSEFRRQKSTVSLYTPLFHKKCSKFYIKVYPLDILGLYSLLIFSISYLAWFLDELETNIF